MCKRWFKGLSAVSSRDRLYLIGFTQITAVCLSEHWSDSNLGTDCIQWRIQDFPDGDANPTGVLNYYLAKFFPKTA